jgi:hypothetical protein
MSGAHGALGWLALGAAVSVALLALAAWSTWGSQAGGLLGRFAEMVAAAATAVVFVALFVGGVLLTTGLRPASVLHLLLAFTALATLPAALALGIWAERGRGRGLQRYRWLAGGGLVTAMLSMLLAQTG